MGDERAAGHSGGALLLITSLALVFSTLTAASPLVATAQETPAYVIAVPTDPSLDAVSGRVAAAARASLRRLDEADWQAADQLYLGYSQSMLDRLRRARTRLAEGRQAFLELELERAVGILEGAVEDFDAAVGALEDTADLAEALLYLGACEAFLERERDANRTFGRLHVQMPHVRPDPDVFSPDVIAAYERAEPRDSASPSGEISVASDPAGTAFVDFVARGTTPVSVDGLMGGAHVVRVIRPGGAPFVHDVSLRRGVQEHVDAFLEPTELSEQLARLRNALVADSLDELRAEELRPDGPVAELASALSVDLLGVVRVGRADGADEVALELVVFDIRESSRRLRVTGSAPVAVGALEAAVQELVHQAMGAALQPASGDAVDLDGFDVEEPEPVETDEGGSVFGTWYFWAGVAAVVVAAGAVVTVLLLTDGQELGADPGGQVVLRF
jgi:hypothetical protein